MINADEFLKRLKALRSPSVAKAHGNLAADEDDTILGVRMGQVFALAKEFIDMSLPEVETMLESPIHEMRVGAVSIMDFQARSKKTTEERRKDLFNLYIKRHDRINTWDLVDRSAPYVVGGYLFNKKRDALYKLSRSKKMPERRTAIVGTGYFIRQGEVEETFKIAELLLDDKEDLIQKAVGWMLRAAGDVDTKKLLSFLDKHTATMPRTLLRYSTEKLDKKQREQYMNLKKSK